MILVVLSIKKDKSGTNDDIFTVCSNVIETLWEEVNVMNKTDLVNAVAEKSDLAKKDATKAVDAVFESVMDSLKNGEKVQLIGFGNFEVRERSERKGRNPQTGEEIKIPASKVPAFKPGKALKESVK